MVSGPPLDLVSVPPAVRAVAGARPVRAVWRNELGGVTFEVGTLADRCFVKWTPAENLLDLDAERAHLAWASAYATVPTVLGHGRDREGAWIVTRALPGESAVSERWRADPATAVAAIGSGLRVLHDTLPVDTCPFSWSLAHRLADVRRRAGAGAIDPQRWHEDHATLDLHGALALLERPPSIDRLVVCHGDTCAPNTLVSDDGRFAGHVDLGKLGVADRWADLAIATWSTQWNYGPGWEPALLDAYGIGPDEERTRYYRLLWDLGP